MKDKELKKKFCEIGKIYGFNTAYGRGNAGNP